MVCVTSDCWIAALSPVGVIIACAGFGARTVAVANAAAAVNDISNRPRIVFLHLPGSSPTARPGEVGAQTCRKLDRTPSPAGVPLWGGVGGGGSRYALRSGETRPQRGPIEFAARLCRRTRRMQQTANYGEEKDGRCGALLPLFRLVGARCIAALRRVASLLRHRSDHGSTRGKHA
jgi:hypothetical protein